jgi:FKBP-type peptidyl-prolyl cis-trans isomerase FklB
MKKLVYLVAALMISQFAQAAESELDTDQKRIGYTLGYQLGLSMRQQGLELDADAASQAVHDAFSGKPSKLTQAEMQAVVQTMNAQILQKQVEVSEKNHKAGMEFLAENKKKKGVTTTKSGLQYKVMTKGKGKKATAADTVVAHYEGRLINGTVFDSSIKRGTPATFPVSGVIKGWQEVLQLMSEGAKWQVYIPADLAYGEKGVGRNIGPNETLIFDIELIKIN